MAATIDLITYNGGTVIPRTDGIIQDASIGRNGVFYGCDVTASANILNVSGGYGLIKGRYFEIQSSTIPVTLATTDDLSGRLYIRLDLSNIEAPIQLLTVTGDSLPALEQDADVNYTDGVWEMEMATFSVTTTEVTDVVETYETIVDNATQIDALNSNVDSLIKFKEYTYTYSLAQGGALNITGQNFGLATPSGYSVLGIVYFNSGSSFAVPTYVAHNAGAATAVAVRNIGSTSLNPTFRVRFAYIRSGAVSS